MKITLRQHIQTFFIDEVNSLIYGTPKHLVIAANTICAGIELLGKICDASCDLKDPYKSRKHFEDALKNFPSLNKYGIVKNSEGRVALYADVRCSFFHGLMNGEYINLAPKNSNGITVTSDGHGVIGVEELFADFIKACNDLLNSKDNSIQNRLAMDMYEIKDVQVCLNDETITQPVTGCNL